jgi:hypothetical protein
MLLKRVTPASALGPLQHQGRMLQHHRWEAALRLHQIPAAAALRVPQVTALPALLRPAAAAC